MRSIAALSLLSEPRSVTPSLLLAHRLRAARRLAHLTQFQLAGGRYSRRFISALERGRVPSSLETVQALARWLGLPVSYFVADPVGGLIQLDEGHRGRQRRHRHGSLLPQDALLRMLGEAEVLLRQRAADAALQALGGTAPPPGLSRFHHPRWYWLCGWAFAIKYQLHEAMTCLQTGLALAEALQESIPPSYRGCLIEMAVRLRSFLGHLATECGESQQALAYVQPCLAAHLEGGSGHVDLELGVYVVLGEASLLEGRLRAAREYFEVALQLLGGLHRPLVSLRLFWGLARVHSKAGDLPLAKRYAQHVLALDLADRRTLSNQAHALLGRILLRQGELEQAEKQVRQALGGALRGADPVTLGIACGGYAEIFLARKAYERAETLVWQGLEMRERLSPRVEGYLLLILAQIYQQTRHQALERTFQEAIRCFDLTSDQFLKQWAHDAYSGFLAEQGRFAEAYHHLCLAYNSRRMRWDQKWC